MCTNTVIYIMGFFYDGYSVLDRIGAAQYYHPINVVALPPFPRLFSPNRDYMPVYVGTFGGRAR